MMSHGSVLVSSGFPPAPLVVKGKKAMERTKKKVKADSPLLLCSVSPSLCCAPPWPVIPVFRGNISEMSHGSVLVSVRFPPAPLVKGIQKMGVLWYLLD